MSLTMNVRVNTNYTRSINLERDSENGSGIRPYIPTSRAIQTLGRIADTINVMESPRAWALIGPYGSGKSAFGLFLSQLLGNQDSLGSKHASQALKASDSGLSKKISKSLAKTQGYFCISLTGSPEALSKRLVKTMLASAQIFFGGKRGRVPNIVKHLQAASERESVTTSEIIELITELQKSVYHANGAGVLIIIDELGKFLEFEARHRNASDIFLLQAIAEFAHKPNLIPIHFIVLLHQSFEQYFQGLGEQLRNEWKKVQGRFESVPFLESTEQILRILSSTLISEFSEEVISRKEVQCQRIISKLVEANALPQGMSPAVTETLFKSCYPLHPLTLLLLPALCQKVAQNERTLFTYLGSQEPHGFIDTLSHLEVTDKELPWVMPWNIYEYFILNQPGLTTDHATHRRWAEVVTALERLGDAPIQEIYLLKTIGLLNIIGAQGGLKASEEIIALCRGEGDEKPFKRALVSLQKKSILNYRKYSGEYRVWQGSDFDLDASVREQKGQLANVQIAEVLNERKPIQPLVARRYGIETGTLRYFKPVFIDRHNANLIVKSDDPTLYLCLSESAEDETNFQQRLEGMSHSLSLGAIIDSGATLRESVLEVIALQRIQRNDSALAADPVVQRELKDRLGAAIRNERNAIASILEEPGRSSWYWRSTKFTVGSKRALQELLTASLRESYSKSPYLHNELINRDRPSSSAMAGRKRLLLAMLHMESSEDLGIEKFPSEKAIYRSILLATGIHVKTGQGWHFTAPKPTKSNEEGSIRLPWQAIEKFLDRTEQSPLLVTDLYAELSRPPYGIKAGVLPVLFLAACLAYKDEIAIYEEGYYSPFFTQELLEKILRSPELFSIQRFRVDHLREQLFKKYAQAVTLDDPATVNMISVAKPLARFMVNLPDYTKRTKRVSEKAQRVREYFFAAKSPTNLLFNDLPVACGFDPITPNTTASTLEDFSRELKLVFAELRVAYHALLSEFQLMIKHTFNESEKTSLSGLRERLRGRYGSLQTYTIDTHGLKAFLGRLSDPYGDDGHWLNSLATFIARKPPEKWLDEDIKAADYRLVELWKRLRDLEQLRTHYEGRTTSPTDQTEVVMLRTVRQGGNDYDVIVALDEPKKKAISDHVESFRQMLSRLPSSDLRLAVLAQLFEEYISAQNSTETEPQATIEGDKLSEQ